MKKIICVTLTFVMLCAMSVPAFAAEASDITTYSATINEYDVYVQTRATPTAELIHNGVSQQTIEVIKSNAIEEELTNLSQLCTDDLSNLGYNSTQIDLLHNYSGERIETNSELRGLFADLNSTFYCLFSSTSSFTVMIEWKWSNCPFTAGTAFNDIVGIVWKGIDNAGWTINLALNSSDSACSINYYNRSNDSFQYSQIVPIKTDDPYGHVYARFTMGDENTSGFYAKTGTLIIRVDRIGTQSIYEASFVFGYGHSIVSVSPSLSLPESFGIGFSAGVEQMDEKAVRVSSDGKVIEY